MCGDNQTSGTGKPVDPAVRDRRDPAFHPGAWGCKSAPFTVSVSQRLQLTSWDQELLGCVSASYSFRWAYW